MDWVICAMLKVYIETFWFSRGVQNHGIRELPHRFKAKYQDQVTGMRYFDKGRFISMYYDSNPKTMREVEGILRQNNDIVLRQTHLKVRNKMWYVNIVNENKNPYIKMVAEMEKQGKLE